SVNPKDQGAARLDGANQILHRLPRVRKMMQDADAEGDIEFIRTRQVVDRFETDGAVRERLEILFRYGDRALVEIEGVGGSRSGLERPQAVAPDAASGIEKTFSFEKGEIDRLNPAEKLPLVQRNNLGINAPGIAEGLFSPASLHITYGAGRQRT